MQSLSDSKQFTPEFAHALLMKACRRAGLDAGDVQLVRLGENAIYRLSGAPYIVRISRSADLLDDVRKEMRVARWLELEEYPAVRLASNLHDGDVPIMVDTHPVTFWQLVESIEPPPGSPELGKLLKRLHELSVPDWLALPEFRPFARYDRRLSSPPAAATADEISFLRNRIKQLEDALAELVFPFPPGPVHGDAHPRNLLRRVDGNVVLLDFEAFCWGPREWDLSLTAGYRYSFEWLSDDEYDAFTDAYGYDVSQWEGFPVLCGIRELGMTTWLMQMADHDQASRDEFHRRVEDLQADRFPRRWRVF